MVRLAGFEPATYGLEVRCSIQLSYRRKFDRAHYYHTIRLMSIANNEEKSWKRDQDSTSQIGEDKGSADQGGAEQNDEDNNRQKAQEDQSDETTQNNRNQGRESQENR